VKLREKFKKTAVKGTETPYDRFVLNVLTVEYSGKKDQVIAPGAMSEIVLYIACDPLQILWPIHIWRAERITPRLGSM
jgi:hypothetical protein